MVGIVDAILALDTNAKVKVQAEDYDKITWYDSCLLYTSPSPRD